MEKEKQKIIGWYNSVFYYNHSIKDRFDELMLYVNNEIDELMKHKDWDENENTRYQLLLELKKLYHSFQSTELKIFNMEDILKHLTIKVGGTDKEFYSEAELKMFAEYYEKECSGEDVVTSFLDYWWDSYKPCRICSICGKLMRAGYCLDSGAKYYCSDECLHHEFTDEEWEEEYNNNDQSYYTEWY